MTVDHDKTDFLIKLGGKKELTKALIELAREHELLRIKIEELVSQSFEMHYGDTLDEIWPTMRVLHKMPGQHKVLFDSPCEDSPYGLCGEADSHVLDSKCIWCHREF